MRVLAALAVLVLIAGCQTAPPEMTEAETAQVEAEVMAWAEAWMDAWDDVETDCERASELFHPDHVVFLTGGEPKRKADWLDYCNGVVTNRAGFTGEWTDKDVRVLSSNAAVFLGRMSGTFEYLDGSPARHYPAGAQLILVERTATGWGITLAENSNGPGEAVEGT